MATVDGIRISPSDFSVPIDHVVGGPPYHSMWDNSLPPLLTIEPGETVLFNCIEAAGGQLTPESTLEEARQIDVKKIHTLTGPIAISGAMPGDTLAVEILGIKHESWAWTAVEPGFGLLADEFEGEATFKIWHVDDEDVASFMPGVRIPVEPFCGVMGVAPKEPGAIITIPPRDIGGNMDTKYLRPSTTVFFPVQVPSALFSAGDGHLAQGDGEICGTALEGPVSPVLKFWVIKTETISAVRYETKSSPTSLIDAAGHFVTTAAGLDLQQLAHDAVSDMVKLLTAKFELTRMDAYVICSAAGSLKMAVPVLGPRHAGFVTFHMPRSIFADELCR